MALINYPSREISCKVVYCGPGLGGKTTNLRHIHANVPSDRRGRLVSLSTDKDRTLFFDFLPIEIGEINCFRVRFQLYTVPGQVYYRTNRKLVLRGTDSVVFVVDSQRERYEANLESLRDMYVNLLENRLNPEKIPIVFQYNKRDASSAVGVDELERSLNHSRAPFFEAVASQGRGVLETLRTTCKLVVRTLQ
ncbi:MAG: GTPase domain-containing protein [Candidatus Eisenbacteria bacterium]